MQESWVAFDFASFTCRRGKSRCLNQSAANLLLQVSGWKHIRWTMYLQDRHPMFNAHRQANNPQPTRTAALLCHLCCGWDRERGRHLVGMSLCRSISCKYPNGFQGVQLFVGAYKLRSGPLSLSWIRGIVGLETFRANCLSRASTRSGA